MAGEFWLPAQALRIVLLAKTGTGKTKLARAILRNEALVGASEECAVYEDIQAGRKICLVNTPGWDTVSIDCTSQKIKNEITRSVTLCAPGPHAVVLVLPVHAGDVPPQYELNSAVQHIELLSERVWNHAMVLFLCDQDVDQSTVNKHVENAGKLLEKCGARYSVLRSSEDSERQINELFKKIEDMVEQNRGGCFLPQVYYEVIQSIINDRQNLNEQPTRDGEENTEGNPRRRRRSSREPPPRMRGEGETVLTEYIREVARNVMWEEVLSTAKYVFKPAVVIGVAVIGALIGSVVGSEYGVGGAGLGIIIGVLVTIPGSLKLIDALKLLP